MTKFLGSLLVAAVLMAVSAGASVVTSIPGGVVIPMPAIDYFGPGPEVFGPGITWSSTNASNGGGAVFGFTPQLPCPTSCYGFGTNGSWIGPLGPMAGLNDSFDYSSVIDTMTFAFASPVSAIGGFLNYLPGSSTSTIISVYGSGHNLIESTNLSFTTSGADDTGQFYGFQESSKIISYFTLTDNFVGITNLTIGAPTPEPDSLLLIGTGLLGVIGYSRRRLGL